MIDRVFSLCTIRDIDVWKISSNYIVDNINAKYYYLVVPPDDVLSFKNISNKMFDVLDETLFLQNVDQYEKLPNWYKQQIIKLNCLTMLRFGEIGLIWDSDTIPVKKLNFFKNNVISFFPSNEYHEPYFDSISRLLNLKKIEQNSFVSQCFPIKYEWFENFKYEIEKKHNENWIKSIVNNFDYSVNNSFSEYETLGTFISHNYKDEYKFSNQYWIRRGYALFRAPEYLKYFKFLLKISPIYFIAFEKWDSKITIYSIFRKIIRKIKSLFKKSKPQVDNYLSSIFKETKNLDIIQVGANDGIQNDPIRRFFRFKGSYRATLIEPIPYYFEKLKLLYSDRDDIFLVNAAISNDIGKKKLYFIPPKIADQMNGDGPQNNWAHGQGSFDIEIIKYWIIENSFRGINYVKNISFYINSIISIDLITSKLSEFQSSSDNQLLVIDAQGFEQSVLKSVDWKNSPKYILIEDDLKNKDVLMFLKSKNYKWVAGSIDKIYKLNSNEK